MSGSSGVLTLAAMLPLFLSAAVLVLVGWAMEAKSREEDHDARELQSGHSLRGSAHEVLELHLAVWIYLGGLTLALAATHVGNRWDPVHTGPWILLALGVITTPLLIRMGRRLGPRPFPQYLRWLLAPFHGFSILVLLIDGVLRSVGRRPGRNGGEGETTPVERAAGAPTPVSLREGVQDLDSLTVEEVMIPRSQVVAVKGDLGPREALSKVRVWPHDRYPVYGESVDQLLGVTRMIDLARPEAGQVQVRDLTFPVPIVPETMNALSLLLRIGAEPVSSALVVDEFGNHAGLVTRKDLIEVLVGELIGEHEIERKRILPLQPRVFKVDGTCRIEEFNEQIAGVLPEGEYETVAGLFLDRVGKIPQPGEAIELPKATIEILERTDRRILWLRVELSRAGAELRKTGA